MARTHHQPERPITGLFIISGYQRWPVCRYAKTDSAQSNPTRLVPAMVRQAAERLEELSQDNLAREELHEMLWDVLRADRSIKDETLIGIVERWLISTLATDRFELVDEEGDECLEDYIAKARTASSLSLQPGKWAAAVPNRTR